MRHVFQKGIGLIEIVIAIFVISVSLFAVIQLSVFALKATADRNDKAKAVVFAQEGMEAVRNIRDGSWTNNIATLTFGATYYLTVSGSQWALTQTNPGALDGKFTRTIMIANVSRDINSNIVSAGGTDDASTKKVTVTVSWSTPAKSVQLVAYLMNILKN
ncbi:hypothetical protein HY250_00755 [Candidatus Azambacteria bacterium]|nr:hypothetical protein [Candidatus Azambacteria bacterium]MBI3684925.1 hypothetical protein [Candidatus Azambacteria bacterium]